jgi:hypothetical protein
METKKIFWQCSQESLQRVWIILDKKMLFVLFTTLLSLSIPNIVWGQPCEECHEMGWDDGFDNRNPNLGAQQEKESIKIEALRTIQGFLNFHGCPEVSLVPDSKKYTHSIGFGDFANLCGSYRVHSFVLPYRDILLPVIRKYHGNNFCDYKRITLLALLDKNYRDSIRLTHCASRHIFYKYPRPSNYYVNDFYNGILDQLVDTGEKSMNAFYFNTPDLNDKKLTYYNLYKLALEIIFINNPELNKRFWKVFSCKREIPVTYRNTSGSINDHGVISVAFAFGAAYADYFYDPLFYTFLRNPYAVALVNGKPFDEKTYVDFIPLMENYIRYVSCQNVKIPFLLKFDKRPENGRYEFQYYPLPEQYYSLPTTCVGKKNLEFPYNFYPWSGNGGKDSLIVHP